MLLFFATIGAGAGSLSALWSTGWLTAFIAIQLGVHLGVIILGGYVLAGLPMQVGAYASCLQISSTWSRHVTSYRMLGYAAKTVFIADGSISTGCELPKTLSEYAALL